MRPPSLGAVTVVGLLVLLIVPSTGPPTSAPLHYLARWTGGPALHYSVHLAPSSTTQPRPSVGAVQISGNTIGSIALNRTAYTLVASNNTLVEGHFSPPSPGVLSGAVYDRQNNRVYAGDSNGDSLFGLNGSTGKLEQTIQVGWTPAELAWDSSDNSILVGTGSALEKVDPSSGAILLVVPGDTSLAVEGSMGLAYDPANGYAYAADFVDDLVLVVNVSSGSYVANVSVGIRPQSLVFDPIHNQLFVGNSGDSSITVIDTATNKVLGNPISLGGTPGNGNSYPYPNCMVFDPSNDYVYVGNQVTRNTTLVDAASRTIEKGSNISTGDCLSMAIDPANGHVYVGSFAGSIADINGTSLDGTNIHDPFAPSGIAFDSRDNLMYAANSGGNTVTIFNASTEVVEQPHLSITETFLTATFNPQNGETYLATPDPGFACAFAGTLTVVNSSDHPQIIASVPVGLGPEASVVAPTSDDIFVANACSDNVTVIDSQTLRPVGLGTHVGTYPIALGYDSLHDQVIVANGGSANLTILNGTTGAVAVSSVSVGSQPDGVAFDPRNGWIYVANYGSDSVSVINSSTDAQAVNPIRVGYYPEDILFDPADGTVIVANSGSGNLTVVNASSGATIASNVPAGVGPVAMALDAADSLLYVADAAGGTVAIVNLTSYAMVGTPVPASGNPQGIIYDPLSQQVDVADFSAGTVSILATVPVISSFGFAPNRLDLGQGTWLAVNATEAGGPPLGLSFSGMPPGCPASNQSAVQCFPTAEGAYRTVVTATDPRGYQGWQAAVLEVNAPASVLSVSVLPNTVDVGQPISINVSTAGGTPPVTYTYWGLPPGCLSRNASSFSCAPTSPGNYTVTVQLTDSTGLTSVGSALVAVNPAPAILLYFASPSPLPLGATAEISAVVTGGSSPLTYSFSGLPPGCMGANTPTLSCTPTANGTYSIRLTVHDSVGGSVTASTSLDVVTPQVPSPSILQFFSAPSAVPVGNLTTFYTVVTGGVQPLTYRYGGLPGGCPSASTSALACIPTSAGVFNVTVLVRDARGEIATALTQAVVTPVPSGPHTGSNGTGSPVTSAFPWWAVVLAGGLGAGAGGGVAAFITHYRTRRSERDSPHI